MSLACFRPWRRAAARTQARALWRSRRGVVSLMFGLVLIPFLLLVGLAVDFAFIAQARAQLDLAADTAALTAAKTAGTAFTNSQSVANCISQGVAAGTAWFSAQVGTIPDASLVGNPTISVTNSGNSFTSTVTYSANVTTIFEKLFGITYVTITNASAASIVANAYVDVTFLLDNSSSMLIAATATGSGTANGVATLQPLTAASSCFQVGGYTGALNGSGLPMSPYGHATSTCDTISYNCTQSAVAVTVNVTNDTYGINGLQGCQCAFACHWLAPTGSNTFTGAGVDTESGAPNPGGNQTYSLDYYGLARAAGVQLRFDVVQSAVETAINYMQTSELIPQQFGAAVYEFNNSFTQVWPPTADSSTQATIDMACLNATVSPCGGNALAAAQGITTPVVFDAADTNFPAAMATLTTDAQASLTAAGLTVAGDGSTQAKAKRALIIVTDGIQDWGNRNPVPNYSLSAGTGSNANGAEGPISMHDCDAIKALGYAVYVLYTTYYVPPPSSLNTLVIYNEELTTYVNTGSGTAYDLTTNLQGCASDPANFATASSQAEIQSTLQSMVQAAINSGARLTL